MEECAHPGVLAQLPQFAGQKVIYCAGCLLGKTVYRRAYIIRQTPYELKINDYFKQYQQTVLDSYNFLSPLRKG